MTLPRPDGEAWIFTVQPLSLGFHRRLREHGVTAPFAPVRLARDSAGRPLRDAAGVVVTTTDAADPQFVEQLEQYHQRVAVLAVAEALQVDPQVSFEARPPAADAPYGAWCDYADALYAELESAGFSAGDLILFCDAIARLSNLIGDHLQQARSNFSSQPVIDSR
ncbi:MAG: hypothetical protein KDA75_08460 [Planctomycetaceae bacterium]|nr:hypothetical protein [Planctomycetaceae bacterium]